MNETVEIQPQKPPSYYQIEVSKLEKLFETVKCRDLTNAQFEREKTERIKALCSALATATNEAGTTNGYYNSSNRDKLMEMLKTTHSEVYQPFDWRYA